MVGEGVRVVGEAVGARVGVAVTAGVIISVGDGSISVIIGVGVMRASIGAVDLGSISPATACVVRGVEEILAIAVPVVIRAVPATRKIANFCPSPEELNVGFIFILPIY